MWSDIVAIVFIAVTANHLGLVKAIESFFEKEIPIVNCPKCLTNWLVFGYMMLTRHNPITSLAVSLLCSYLAIWLELFEGFIDLLYQRLYEKIYSADDTATGE